MTQSQAFHGQAGDALCTDFRIVLCGDCGSEGRIYVGQYEDERCIGACGTCEGTGGEIIAVFPIDLDDLEICAPVRGEPDDTARAS